MRDYQLLIAFSYPELAYSNDKCYQAMAKVLGITPDASWFIYDISTKNQDELHFSAVVVNSTGEEKYKDSKARKEVWQSLIEMDIIHQQATKGLTISHYGADLSPIIYYGVPGTGKTHKVQTEIFSLYHAYNRFLVTFHQSFSYEEFVEGLKPIMDSNDDSDDIKYQIEEGIFSKACERAAKLAGYSSLSECIKDDVDSRASKMNQAIEEQKTVLLCIDELNRGNVASIFGDLISLIEPSKRLGGEFELVATLPYSKRLFGVPANLFIVGTMNTADRSIQLLDSAIRRRFKFEELLPSYDVITNGDAKAILQGINSRIRCLLNKDSQIGHSYLMHSKTNKDILDALTNKIIPLLEEYFYNDLSQVRFVLNEMKDDKYNFYKEDKAAKDAFTSYQNFADIDAEDKSFYSLDDSIMDVEGEEECAKYLQHLLPPEE